MTIDEIRQLIHLTSESGIAELEVQRGEDRVRIRRGNSGARTEITVSPEAAQTPQAQRVSAPAPATGAAPEPAREKEPAAADPNLVLVKSPIVGTFYESPSPDSPPFVRVGERVQPGKVLCIIESMKLMNEIESDVEGEIVAVYARNGQPVEYGEKLFGIRLAA